MKRFSFVLPLLLLGGCSSNSFETKSLSEGFKGNIDYVRDAFGQPITRIPKDQDAAPFPAVPVDPRPDVRTQKQRTDLVNEMKDDHAAAAKVSAAVAKSSDPTRYIAFNGKPPTAQPIALTFETVKLPDGVRDIDTVDPTRLGGWSDMGTIDFKEGSAELPDTIQKLLAQAAHLISANQDARIVGYSASERLALPDKGPHETNRYLADLRARKVAEALIELGVAPSKLVVGAAAESDRKSADKVEILIDY